MENELEKIPTEPEITETAQVDAPVKTEVKDKTVPKKEAKVQAEKEDTNSHKRVLQGKVTSNKANKTIVVKIERQVAHPLYKKYFKRSKKVMAHDENNECNIGDIVNVREHRPLSRFKRWMLKDIVKRAK